VAVDRDELFRAIQDDLDGPAGLAGERCQRSLVTDERLGSERAAHRRADDPDAVLLDPERDRKVRSQVERRLRARPQGQPPVLPLRDRGVRLHRRVRRAGRPKCLLNDDVRVGEPVVNVAVDEAEAVADVRARQRADADRDRLTRGLGARGMHERRPGRHRLHRVIDGRQLLVGDVDQAGRRASRRARRRGHGGDDVARVPGDPGEHVLVADLAAVEVQLHDVGGEQRDALRGHGGSVDRAHASVRMRAAHERRVEHAGTLGVHRVALRADHAAVDPDRRHRPASPTSSTARRTSTATTRRRYSALPRASDNGCRRSA
jgi:hypothetical protein